MATRPKTNTTNKAIQKATHQTASAANHNNVVKPVAMAVESITTEPTATNDPAASGKVSRKKEKKFPHEVRRTNPEERLESVAPKPMNLAKPSTKTEKAPAILVKASTKTPSTNRKKPEAILALISRVKGASVSQLQEATGWQRHSIRAAISGLRKRGLRIVCAHTKDGSHYSAAKD
jgi:hypothetical protein